MSEMIERVAKAMQSAPHGDMLDHPFLLALARAAIEAMRDAPLSMFENIYCGTSFSSGDETSSCEYVSDENKLEFWQAMIDATLATEPVS